MTGSCIIHGNNLDVLETITPYTVDLIYLDPPFNSNRDYQTRDGRIAFVDKWKTTEQTYQSMEFVKLRDEFLHEIVLTLSKISSRSGHISYLFYMAHCLLLLKQCLRNTGSIYLHCDSTESHYLKTIMDVIWGVENFRNEIIWKRTFAHSSAKGWAPIHDVILYYATPNSYTWNQQYQDYAIGYVDKFYRKSDAKGNYQLVSLTAAGVVQSGDSGQPWKDINPTEKGRHWAIPGKTLRKFISTEEISNLSTQEKLDILEEKGYVVFPKNGIMPRYKRYSDETPGMNIQDIVTDVPPLSSHANERIDYPTQKPEKLLERIISASSNPGDVVLDPFAGSGTTGVVAQKLGRQYILIDQSEIAIQTMCDRIPNAVVEVIGDE